MTHEELKTVIRDNTEASWQEARIMEALELYAKSLQQKVSDIADRLLSYCEEIDLHIPEEERSGYDMLPDILALMSIVKGVQMSRLTRRAEADGVKAVWFGNREVFLEGEVGYAEADKLAHYEDLEEQGRHLELPCSEGDTVWCLSKRQTKCTHENKEFDEYLCAECEVRECDSRTKMYIRETKASSIIWIVTYLENFGRTIFLTEAAAEAKLAELKEGGKL